MVAKVILRKVIWYWFLGSIYFTLSTSFIVWIALKIFQANLIAGLFWAGYWFLSYFFFFFPNVIHSVHKNNPKLNRIVHISHRGGSCERPENTMSAFQNAYECGTHMIELDLYLTKDEQVVVFHDPTLFRLTGRKEQITELNYSELPPKFLDYVSIGPYDFQEPLYVAEFDSRIPLLEEVFQAFPNVPINLEFKQNSDLLMKKTYELICKYNRKDIVVWGSFNSKIVDKCKLIDPSVPRYFSLQMTLIYYLCYLIGILPFLNIGERFFETPCFNSRHASHHSWKVVFILIFINAILHNRFLFWHYQRRGIRLFAWTLNEDIDFVHAFGKGFQGVMTDFPHKLSSFLDSHLY